MGSPIYLLEGSRDPGILAFLLATQGPICPPATGFDLKSNLPSHINHNRLRLQIRPDALLTQLSPLSTLLPPTKRRRIVGHERPIDSHRARLQGTADAQSTREVRRVEGCGKAGLGVVGERDDFFLGLERADAEDGAEDLFAPDTAFGVGVEESGGENWLD
jgi:hypothetical protein